MSPIPVPSPLGVGQHKISVRPADNDLKAAARDLEATFLSEMLKAMKLDESSGNLGSDTGTSQFGSFLVDAQAKAIVNAGGIGMAEALFEAMVTKHAA